MRTLQVREAKATFSALVEAAQRGEPTTITRRGKAAAVLVSVEDAQRLYPDDRPSFADFLLSFPCPLPEIERDQTPLRGLDL